MLLLIQLAWASAQEQGASTSQRDTHACTPVEGSTALDVAGNTDQIQGSCVNDQGEPDAIIDNGESLSNYAKSTVVTGGAKSVDAELVAADRVKTAIFPIDVIHSRLKGYYTLKDRLHDRFGLRFNIDFSAIAQYATFSTTEQNASSTVFRVLGSWLNVGDPAEISGSLIWKFEARTAYTAVQPRNLGFDALSALSTSNYKDQDWGPTNLYWKQSFGGGRHQFIAGHIDPGDWTDQYPLMNPWTYWLSDAFNFPTEPVPKQGTGFAMQSFFPNEVYFAAGIADANGKGSRLDVDSFFDVGEYFTWAEIGYRPGVTYTSGTNLHLHYWHQDKTVEQGFEESWGLNFNYSNIIGSVTPFVRVGYAEGDAPFMRRLIGAGATFKVFGRDDFGIATSWGSPPDKSLRDQVTSEIFYRLQLTQNWTFTPNIQWTINPSYNPVEDQLIVFSLRTRLVF